MQPKPEHRIRALEKRAATLEATVEELSSDTSEGLRVIRQHVDQGFDQAHAFVQERFASIASRLDRMEATQAELKTTVAEQGKRLDTMDSKLDQILALLRQRPGE